MSVPAPKGSAFPLWQPKDEYEDDFNGGSRITRTYRDLYATWLGRAPALYTGFPGSEAYYLKTRNAKQLDSNGALCDVTLTYATFPNALIHGWTAVPADLVDENDASYDEAIELHPQFGDEDVFAAAEKVFDPTTQKFIGFTQDSKWYGTSTFKVGGMSVSITRYALSPFEPINDQIGLLSDPGHGFGNEGNWLLISGKRGKQGVFYTVTAVYEFSSIGYITGLYSYPTGS